MSETEELEVSFIDKINFKKINIKNFLLLLNKELNIARVIFYIDKMNQSSSFIVN